MTERTSFLGDRTVGPGTGDDCPRCRTPVNGSWLVCARCGERLASPAELEVGATLAGGRFVVRRVLGRGGFGITYEVDDRRLERRVAVKELFPEPAVRHGRAVLPPPGDRQAFRAARDRFLREARMLARFDHPGIVRVYEVFEEHDTAYLVLELVEGTSLAEVLRRREGPLAEDEVRQLATRIGAALTAVHAAGMLHRDLSPSNLLVTERGRIVLIDFGLARTFAADRSSSMTRVLTPGYAPPEQYHGTGPFGPPTDVYGLAATLYRLVTRRVPPPAVERERGAVLEPPDRLNPKASKLLSDAILDGLELDPAHRPQTVEALLARMGLGRASLVSDAEAAPVVVAPPSSDDPTITGAELADDVPTQGVAAVVPTAAAPAAPTAVPPLVATAAAVPAWPPPPRAPAPAGDEWLPRPAAADGPEGPSPGRWKVTVPATVAAVVLASGAPVAVVVLLVALVLPALATHGDVLRHRRRRRSGEAAGRLQRAPAPAVAPVRFLRNLVVSAGRAFPPLVVLGVLVAAWYALEALDVPPVLGELLLRGAGAAVALMLLVPAADGSPGFRTGLAVDDIAARILGPGGRMSQRAWVLWIVALGLTAGGLFLTPEPWPLPS